LISWGDKNSPASGLNVESGEADIGFKWISKLAVDEYVWGKFFFPLKR
jgi:hypothetical protein